jgi:hypothetical protein
MSRRDFALPEEDCQFLDRLGFVWETVIEGNVRRVVVYGYGIPSGYRQTAVDLNVRIENSYPDTQIDMVYFSPALERVDGGAIKAICQDAFDGRVWQRWSRHRTTQNPWRAGVDNLEAHLLLVNEWLAKEAI